MSLYSLLGQAALFLPAVVRITCIFIVAPFFGTRSVPIQAKIGLSCLIALMVLPQLHSPTTALENNWLMLILVLVKEALTGLVIGFIGSLLFYSLQVAGQILDLQIGLSFANVVDPQSGTSAPLLGNFYTILAMMLFIGIGGDGAIISAIFESFRVIPIGTNLKELALLSLVVKAVTAIVIIGLKLAMPVVTALFLTDVALAIISKIVPQMNVFVLGLPLKIGIGFMILAVGLPAVVYVFRLMFQTLFQYMDMAIRTLGG